MKSIVSLFLICFTVGFQTARAAESFPGLPKMVKCPAIGDEYAKLLSKLDAIKASIKADANCKHVELKVKSLEDLLVTDRQKILDITSKSKEQILSQQEAALVADYAENVTTKVASLYDLFTDANRCFADDKAEDSLAQLASFASEASRLVASVSGPWGTPIALAGHVVAGFLTGLDKVMKSRVGYDFQKPDQWKNYVQTLCTFHSYQDQVEHLLNPQAKLQKLKALSDRLKLSLSQMTHSCAECEVIESNLGKKSESELEAMAQSVDRANSKPLGSYTLYGAGIQAWVQREMTRVQQESTSYWAGISGRHVLAQSRYELQSFLVDREAPRFLAYQIGKASQDHRRFMTFAGSEGRGLYYQISRANQDAVVVLPSSLFADPIQYFQALILNPIRWELMSPTVETEDLRYAWQHYRDQGLNLFSMGKGSLQVVQGFCGFFQQSSYYSPAIRSYCTSRSAQDLASQIASLEKHLSQVRLQAPPEVDTQIFSPVRPLGEKAPLTRLETIEAWSQFLSTELR
ncbi:MAG: hypothetical protein AB7F86_08805 [Bdellovibrionales bacterium]